MNLQKLYIIVAFCVAELWGCHSNTKECACGDDRFKKFQDSIANNQHKTKFLQGIWAIDESSNAVFNIHNDTVNYCTEVQYMNTPYKYLISADTLLLQYDGAFTKHLILKLDTDSLVMKGETGEIGRYYNRSLMQEKNYYNLIGQ